MIFYHLIKYGLHLNSMKPIYIWYVIKKYINLAIEIVVHTEREHVPASYARNPGLNIRGR